MKELMVFSDRQMFRDWLEENGETAEGMWLLFGKKGGPVTVSAAEALEEALCFGWIDGVMEKIDETSYKKYFARRISKSIWSEKNKGLTKKLIEQGLMTDRGQAAIDRARQNGMWDASPRLVIGAEQIEEFKNLVRPYELAYTNLSAMSPSVQKSYTGFYFDAKSEKTRENRLQKIIDRLNQNLKPM